MSEQTIEKQLEFVEWLKEKGIYNRFATATNMQAMYEVWDKMIIPKHETVEQWETRTGDTYPDDGPVWKDKRVVEKTKSANSLPLWTLYEYNGWSPEHAIVANHNGNPEEIK